MLYILIRWTKTSQIIITADTPVKSGMETNEHGPPAKASKQHLNSNGGESADQSVRVKSSYALEMFRRQYLNERSADVFFTFEASNERVPAHKLILSSASNVFDEMFYGSSPSALGGDILIVGYSAKAFQDFLQFFYLDEITLKQSTIKEVVRLLHTHEMPKCLEICGQFWFENYDDRSIDDICMAYECAINLQMEELRTNCERKISIKCEEIFKTSGFQSCSYGVIDRILGLDSLLCDESMVLTACLDWARRKCNKNGKDSKAMENLREYLTNHSKSVNLLYKIRYGSIAHAEFLLHFDANDGLFADASEREDVMRLILGSKDSKTDKFQTKPRTPLWFDDHGVECIFPKNGISPEYTVTGPIVHVLKTILFGGFYSVKIITSNGNQATPMHVMIKEQRKGDNANSIVWKLIHSEHTTVKKMSNDYVQLKPNPVHMKPDCEYRIEIDFESDDIGYLDEVECFTFKRNDLCIQIRSKSVTDDFVMKGFKFIPL